MRWYREYLASFPSDPAAAQSNFLLAQLLFEDNRFAEASVEYEKVAYGTRSTTRAPTPATARARLRARCSRMRRAAEQPALQRATVASALRFAQTFPADARNGSVLTDAARSSTR